MDGSVDLFGFHEAVKTGRGCYVVVDDRFYHTLRQRLKLSTNSSQCAWRGLDRGTGAVWRFANGVQARPERKGYWILESTAEGRREGQPDFTV